MKSVRCMQPKWLPFSIHCFRYPRRHTLQRSVFNTRIYCTYFNYLQYYETFNNLSGMNCTVQYCFLSYCSLVFSMSLTRISPNEKEAWDTIVHSSEWLLSASTSVINYFNRRKVPAMHNYSKEAKLTCTCTSLVTLHKELQVRKNLQHPVVINDAKIFPCMHRITNEHKENSRSWYHTRQLHILLNYQKCTKFPSISCLLMRMQMKMIILVNLDTCL